MVTALTSASSSTRLFFPPISPEELLKALHAKDLQVVKDYVRDGGDVNVKLRDGIFDERPLLICLIDHAGSSDQCAETVQLLISQKVDVHVKDVSGKTALHVAAGRGACSSIPLLVQAGADVNTLDNSWGTPLHHACIMKKAEAIRVLIQCGADPDVIVNVKNWTECGLFHAIYSRDLEVVKAFFIGNPLPIVAEEYEEVLASRFAAKKFPEAVPLLQQYERDPLLAQKARSHPMLRILTSQQLGLIKTYITDVNASLEGPRSIKPPLLWWISCMDVDAPDFVEGVRFLLSQGADVNATDSLFKETALHVAAARGAKSIVPLLTEAGAKINAQDAQGRTPLLVACDSLCGFPRWGAVQKDPSCMIDTIRLLLQKGANPDILDNSSGTCLTLAIILKNHPLVELLLKEGKADPNLLIKEGSRTTFVRPAFYALGHQFPEALELLIQYGAVYDEKAYQGNHQFPGTPPISCNYHDRIPPNLLKIWQQNPTPPSVEFPPGGKENVVPSYGPRAFASVPDEKEEPK